ncbi:MAG TPA: alpha/beta fold hydrolase [Streptosporangiaceae bacterium]|jgi:2,6-dihydroxypseudooxynicotine hydrolase|nr:alpha/beta fold hydrolase [Streptosporangiaceae bacterium]
MDDRLDAMYERFTWRILSNYVSPWEFEQLKQEVTDFEQWCGAWSAQARTHVDRADTALAAGRRLTAGDAYLRAGLLYHWASFLFSHDKDQYRAALQAMSAVWRKAAPLLDPPMRILEVPFGELTLPGYLRIPSGVTRPPVVIMFPGGDSVKEELYNLGDYIVARGLAFAAFDGPGQGMVSFEAPLRPDYELVIRAVIDSLAARDDLDIGRLAVGGISYGGLFAIRAAAIDDRIGAVASISSWYTPAGRFERMPPLLKTGQYQHLGPDPAAMMESITLAGVAGRATVPLLQVYGGLDTSSPPESARRIAAEYGGPVTNVVFDDGVHILNNIYYKARPLVADWLAEALAGQTP